MRSPRANLESLYGVGPVGSPYLYRRDDPAKLLDNGGDVPRNQEGIALIGDPRNDTHVFMSQMQVAFIRAHNRLVDRLRRTGAAEADLFDEARRSLAWHYQWLIVNEYLPGLVGPDLVHEVLADGPRYYASEDPYIPVEFAHAAFRYGHSQIRQRYQLRPGGPQHRSFLTSWASGRSATGPSTGRSSSTCPDAPRHSAPSRWTARCRHPLIQLPPAITGVVDDAAFHSLAARDLVRGQGTGLPSGEAVARRMGVAPLTVDEIGLREHGWEAETPLWLYILRESSIRHAATASATSADGSLPRCCSGSSRAIPVLPTCCARLGADTPEPNSELQPDGHRRASAVSAPKGRLVRESWRRRADSNR